MTMINDPMIALPTLEQSQSMAQLAEMGRTLEDCGQPDVAAKCYALIDVFLNEVDQTRIYLLNRGDEK